MTQIKRRTLLRSGAGVAAAGILSAPMVHAQGTGGTLRCGFWDHWVPNGNVIMRQLCAEWGQANRVDVQMDTVTSNGNQILLTINAQAQSRTGYDLMSFPAWEPSNHQRMLEPVDDVMRNLTQKYGAVTPAAEYLGKPAGPGADQWNWETFAKAAEACHKAGFSFGLPMGSFTDAVDWVGALFESYGAFMMDARGTITVRNNAKLRAAVEMCARISRFLPNDVWAWDDGGNNRALISGRSALVFNPPSAWAVAKRDAPQVAENCWTVPMPAGPEGRFAAYLPYFWGIWNFSRSKGAAKAFLEWLSDRAQAERQTNGSAGYDIPPFTSMSDFKVWETEGPPVGSVYNYPVRAHHNAKTSIAMAPAPAAMAVQMYNQGLNTKLVARIVQGGESVDQALTWVERELNTIRRGG